MIVLLVILAAALIAWYIYGGAMEAERWHEEAEEARGAERRHALRMMWLTPFWPIWGWPRQIRHLVKLWKEAWGR